MRTMYGCSDAKGVVANSSSRPRTDASSVFFGRTARVASAWMDGWASRAWVATGDSDRMKGSSKHCNEDERRRHVLHARGADIPEPPSRCQARDAKQ